MQRLLVSALSVVRSGPAIRSNDRRWVRGCVVSVARFGGQGDARDHPPQSGGSRGTDARRRVRIPADAAGADIRPSRWASGDRQFLFLLAGKGREGADRDQLRAGDRQGRVSEGSERLAGVLQ